MKQQGNPKEMMVNNIRILGVLFVQILIITACSPDTTNNFIPTLASSILPTEAPKVLAFDSVWDRVNENYVYEDFAGVDWLGIRDDYRLRATATSTDELFAEIIREMLDLLPADTTTWQTRDERIAEEISAEETSNYEGIGAFVVYRDLPEPHIVLLSIIRDSPALRAGLKARDSLIAVNGLPITAEEGIDAVDRVRGLDGTTVVLTVRSPGEQLARDVIVIRGMINPDDPNSLEYHFINDSDVLYLFIPRNPASNLTGELVRALDLSSQEKPIGGLVIDLRIASTGAGWPLLEFLTAFTDGVVGEFYSKINSEQVIITGQDFLGSQSFPMAVLIGPDTQGAPELFAGSLQGNGRAIIVGLQSPGLIEGSNVFALQDGSQLVVATSSFTNLSGADVGLNGVIPNITVDTYWDQVLEDFDPVIEAAFLEVSKTNQ